MSPDCLSATTVLLLFNGVKERCDGGGVVTGKDDVVVADRIVEEIFAAAGVIFWLENDLCAT